MTNRQWMVATGLLLTARLGSVGQELGTKLWEFTAGGPIRSSPVISDSGTIYFAAEDRKLYALNPDGSKQWDFATSFDIHSTPAIRLDGTIYFASDNIAYALNPDVSKKWENIL